MIKGFNAGHNPAAAMPTGTGKALLLAMLAKTLCSYSEHVRVTIAQHVQELVEQNFAELKEYWPGADAGIYAAGLGEKDASHRITLASVQSAVKDPAAFGKQNILLIDEAHMLAPHDSSQYQTFISALKATSSRLLVGGVSATPWRVKAGHIVGSGLFDHLAYDISGYKAFEALIKLGFLMNLKSKPTNFHYDTDKLKKTGGEFSKASLAEMVKDRKLTEKALQESYDRGSDRAHWLLFCSGIAHIEMVHEILTYHGFECAYVHSKMKDKGQRKEAIDGFKMGHYRGIASDGILTTGFNSPWVDHIVMLISTAVAGKHVQILGRGTRPYYRGDFDLDTVEGRFAAIECGGKSDCLVSDFGTNLDRLGPINDPLIPGRKLKTGQAPIKICTHDKLVEGKGCGEYNYCGARFCVECGCEFIFNEEPKIDNPASEAVAVKVHEEAEYAWVPVESAEYDVFQRPGVEPALKATYKRTIEVGMKASQIFISELVSLEHPKPVVRHYARDWFRKRGMIPPESTYEAMGLREIIPVPSWVLVQVNTRYPKVRDVSFDQFKPEYTP